VLSEIVILSVVQHTSKVEMCASKVEMCTGKAAVQAHSQANAVLLLHRGLQANFAGLQGGWGYRYCSLGKVSRYGLYICR